MVGLLEKEEVSVEESQFLKEVDCVRGEGDIEERKEGSELVEVG